jgi:hypothetical protein
MSYPVEIQCKSEKEKLKLLSAAHGNGACN